MSSLNSIFWLLIRIVFLDNYHEYPQHGITCTILDIFYFEILWLIVIRHYASIFFRIALYKRWTKGNHVWHVKTNALGLNHMSGGMWSCCLLTLYQTTNFRLFQTERVCRRQFQIWRKWQKATHTGRKHCWKSRNCSLRAIFPFPSVFNRLASQGSQKVSLCGNGLNLSQTTKF